MQKITTVIEYVDIDGREIGWEFDGHMISNGIALVTYDDLVSIEEVERHPQDHDVYIPLREIITLDRAALSHIGDISQLSALELIEICAAFQRAV
jgi:ureidoglycolate hydrolase